MTIYKVLNPSETPTYFCPDQETVDKGKSLKISGSFVLGTQDDANIKVFEVQQNFYNLNKDRFSICQSVIVDDGVAWTAIDLDTEPDNTDKVYQVFDAINGSHEEAIGLNSAKNLLNEKKQKFFNYYNIAQPIEMDKFPVQQVQTTGTQTL